MPDPGRFEGGDASAASASPGRIVNQVSGVVGGSVVQARDIAELHLHLPPAAPVPRQLPPAPSPFVNRNIEFGLFDRLTQPSSPPGAPRVVLVTGGHGVGKSATSRCWAHANSDRFVDGQLYVDFDDVRHRGGVGIADVLGGLLRALGLGENVIPSGLADRVALFRSRLAGKRVLLLLDDARYAAEVVPLIPAGAECCVLVTTRAPLQQLLADGAGVVRLDPLDEASARSLLAEMIGVWRVAAEAEAVDELRRICDGLPVALRICGGQLAGRHARRPVSWLVDCLADEERRLEQLTMGVGGSLQAVFDEAYRGLLPNESLLYRALGTQTGRTFTARLAAALLPVALPTAEALLGALIEAHLVEDLGERQRFHELLWTHAHYTARREDAVDVREAIISRMIGHYLDAAQRMDHAIMPDRLRFAAAPDSAGSELAFAGPAQALGWFEAERANLLCALRAAHERERHAETWQLAEAMWIAYNNRKHYEEAREVYALGVEGAVGSGDVGVEARMRQQLARAEIELEQFDVAKQELDRAGVLAADSDNERLKASIMEFRGVLEISRGAYRDAIAILEQARAAFGRQGYRRGVALQEYMLGRAYSGDGDHASAIEHLRQAERLVDPKLDVLTHGRILLRLGEGQLAARRLGDAVKSLSAAVEVMRGAEALFYVASALEALADVRHVEGAKELERGELEAAVVVHRAVGNPRAEVIQTRLEQLLA